MYDIVCVGHITKDRIVTPETINYQAGGTAWYVAQGLKAIDAEKKIRWALITAMATTDRKPVEDLRNEGCEVICFPSEKTLFFENKYGENFNHRTQKVLAKANAFTLEQVTNIKARYTILGSLLAHDFPVEAFEQLHKQSCLVVDVQGYLREVQGEEVHAVDWHEKQKLLKHVDILKLNEYEMEVLTGETEAKKAALKLAEWGVREVLLTFGSYGSLIYDSSTQTFHEIAPIPPKRLVDATGCGDTYVMGYVYQRAIGASVEEAGKFASKVASLKLENQGPLLKIKR
ncbi:MAG: PfkB family carbohydrate kinase [Bacteroidales bacterium]|nr:PfkB family carbohydrate kinase [Bacteroidales bacterium]